MVHLEEEIAPRLQPIMCIWKRYVDDTFTFVKKNHISEVINEINAFHPNIKFTHETEQDNKIAFLDVLLTKREDGNIETSVYRKPTNNSIYIHWNAFGPRQWKTGTLYGIVRRAYEICSTEESRKKELEFISDVFTRINGYPQYLLTNILKKAKDKHNTETNDEQVELADSQDERKLILKMPFRGEQGEVLIKKLNETLRRNIPETGYRIVHTGSKLSRYFSLKDTTDKKHRSNIIYKHECQNKKCSHTYIGETARRIVLRAEDHTGKDKNSHIFQHSSSTKHPRAKEANFEVLASNYPNRRKRKLAEAMFIRDEKPSLNIQKDSYRLALFG